jgi:hypothetical protein
MQALLDEAHSEGLPIDVPAGLLAQAWRARAGPGQARVARTLHLTNVTVAVFDEPNAKATGILCGQRGTSDPIDASVVINARQRHQTVITSAPRIFDSSTPHSGPFVCSRRERSDLRPNVSGTSWDGVVS